MTKLVPFKTVLNQTRALKGGEAALDALLPNPRPLDELQRLGDDRWLSQMSRCVFQAGFNWTMIDNKWPRFEQVFGGFDPGPLSLMSDDDLDGYLRANDIVRHARKILSIQANAQFVLDMAQERGAFGSMVTDWPRDDFVGLLALLKKRGSRLGGNTGALFLRFMGVDGFNMSPDVARALIELGVVDKHPTSAKDFKAVQEAFSAWSDESGRPFMHISKVLAYWVG